MESFRNSTGSFDQRPGVQLSFSSPSVLLDPVAAEPTSELRQSGSDIDLSLPQTVERLKLRDAALAAILSDIEGMKMDAGCDGFDEQLWDIMSRLEDMKREFGDIPVDAEDGNLAVVSFQKRLAEIKAALLPLLAASEQPLQVPAEEQETENEIARFSDDFTLVLNQHNWETKKRGASKSTLSNVISVCGDTHVGKSTILSSLLSSEPGRVAPEVAQPQQNSPTTANVNCYQHKNFSERIDSVHLLDLEGENGGKPPKTALCTRLMHLLDTMGVTEYQERRRKAVAENLARLAFVVSDVVVYIWNESFANASYLRRVQQLAHDSTEGVDSANSPALVLVYNKCSLDEQFDIEKCTAEFFENVENKQILPLYSDVKCICIPHMDQMKKLRIPGRPTQYIDGEEIYALQIHKLSALLDQLLQKRMTERERNGCLFSEKVWCILFGLVINRFHKKLRMGEILSNIMRPRHYLSAKAFDFFRQTYDMVGIFSPKEFLQCREAAVQMLACLCVDHLKMKQKQFDKFIMSSFKSEAFQYQAKQMLRDLLDHIDRLAPCAAVYPGSYTGGNTTAILCTQERMCHGVFHRTSQRVNLPSTATKKVTKLLENVQFWVGVGYRPTWPGEHQLVNPKDPSQELEEFLNMIELLSRVLASNYFLTRVSILQKALHYCQDRKVHNQSTDCWLCLSNLANRQLDTCRHIFCAKCVDNLSHVLPSQVPVEINAEQEAASGFFPVIGPSKCPICYQCFRETVSSEQLFSKIVARFDDIFGTGDQ